MQSPIGSIKPFAHVAAATHGDRTVLVDYLRGEYYSLNAVGATLWLGLTDGMELEEVMEQVISQCDVDRTTLERDLIALLRDLVDRSLVYCQ
jgi:hypothetical protein